MKRKGLMTREILRRRSLAKIVALCMLLAAIVFGLPSILEATVGIR